VQTGAFYQWQTPGTDDADGWAKDPGRPAPHSWLPPALFTVLALAAGYTLARPGRRGARLPGAAAPPRRRYPQLYVPSVSEGGERCLDYGDFAVFGDREVLQEVRTILAAEGFQPARTRANDAAETPWG
jgi:hypothetical protein